jgi:hypothetical protein
MLITREPNYPLMPLLVFRPAMVRSLKTREINDAPYI